MAEPLPGPRFQDLGGNDGSVSAFDHEKRRLFVLGRPRHTRRGQEELVQLGLGQPSFVIVQIDVDSAEVTSHPALQGEPWSKFGLSDMAFSAGKQVDGPDRSWMQNLMECQAAEG
eukprot:SAG22_NODE_8538_length_647_cov_1.114964_2_plen_114_part_01